MDPKIYHFDIFSTCPIGHPEIPKIYHFDSFCHFQISRSVTGRDNTTPDWWNKHKCSSVLIDSHMGRSCYLSETTEHRSDCWKRYQNYQNPENRRKWNHMARFGLRIRLFEAHSHFQSIATPPDPKSHRKNSKIDIFLKIKKSKNPGSAAMGGWHRQHHTFGKRMINPSQHTRWVRTLWCEMRQWQYTLVCQ